MKITNVQKVKHKMWLVHFSSNFWILWQPWESLLAYFSVNLINRKKHPTQERLWATFVWSKSGYAGRPYACTYIIIFCNISWVAILHAPFVHMARHVHFVNDYFKWCNFFAYRCQIFSILRKFLEMTAVIIADVAWTKNEKFWSAFMLNTYEDVIAPIHCSNIVQILFKRLTRLLPIYVTFPAECVLSRILLSTICKNYVCVDLWPQKTNQSNPEAIIKNAA